MADFEEITLTLPEGYAAYGRYWPVEKPRGAVLHHHGIQSHCGWFEGSVRRLWQAGFTVLQVDRRGSGRNSERRGQAESADQLIGDALAARDDLLRRSGCSDYHVVGVSWGGKLAVAAHVKDPQRVLSLSLVTPGLYPIMASVSGQDKWDIGFAMLYEPMKQIDIPLNDAELFTHEPRWREFFATEELTLRQATASFFLASRRMDKLTPKLSKAPPVPVHVLLAEDEHIIDNERTCALFRDLNWPSTRITTYNDRRHGLEFVEDPAGFYADLLGFIEEQTAPAET